MESKYILDPYKCGGSNRYVCPACGKRKSFTRYVDKDTGQSIDPSCGLCNHKSSCGYHYPPGRFFADHPERKPGRDVLGRKMADTTMKPTPPPPPRQLCTMPEEYVVRSHSPNSVFWHWMGQLTDDTAQLERVFDDYRLGATRDGGVIFWQIDHQQRVRTGKIMYYGDDGHRVGHPNWTHSLLMKNQTLPSDWVVSQCFFGEHLIDDSSKDICLVESEKTALICAVLYPDYLWIATGGCSGLTAEKCKVLKGHKVVVYPDSGVLEKWASVMKQTRDIAYTMIDDLEQYEPNTDIADIILGEAKLRVEPKPGTEPTQEPEPEPILPEPVIQMIRDHPLVGELVEMFDLAPLDECPF